MYIQWRLNLYFNIRKRCESYRIMSQKEGSTLLFEGGIRRYMGVVVRIYLLLIPWGCKARLDLHQHLSLDGAWQALDKFTPGLIYRLQPLRGLSWCCHCTEAAISPISLIMAGKYQLVFYPTVKKRQIPQSSSTIAATTHSMLLMSHLLPWACVAQIQQIDMNQFSFVRLWR